MEGILPLANSSNAKALIIEGGGMKGSFSGGVLSVMAKYCPASNFDVILAVSSGSCSAAYYATAQSAKDEHLQNIIQIWRNELDGRKLINRLKFFLGLPMLNQNYLIDYLMKVKYPLPLKNFNLKNLPPFHIVVSNIKKLKPEYIRATEENLFSLLRAATSLPIATKGKFSLNGNLYTDGAVLDPLPVRAVVEAGYKDITVVMNNPIPQSTKGYSRFMSNLAYPLYNKLAKVLSTQNYYRYSSAKEMIVHPPAGVKIRAIYPSFPLLGLVTTNKEKLNRAINHGIERGTVAFKETRKGIEQFLSLFSL
ncbi:patatin-like phospholipase family protein [Leptospira sp. GIMC2001]|uniref:patatin-like phospholipase family protein n=1 Tax=Leptospira sp. GIMC2001 TaxID=1513297 RepID=UPI00234BAF6C|nr:patatin-like phospholipase family protein [Leptospira sp. GIMC2001]WCL48892.1 patatin-like phospholipase family protein [Leptospira sp. GIMC2001]